MQTKHERKPDCHFSRCHRENEQKHHLTIRLSPPRAGCNKGKAGCIQHDFKRHQREHYVTACQQAYQTQHEQDRR